MEERRGGKGRGEEERKGKENERKVGKVRGGKGRVEEGRKGKERREGERREEKR